MNKIEDTNGNFISITYVANTEQSINTITDTLGRVITFSYNATTKDLTGISWNGQTWAFTFNDAYTLNYNYSVGVLDSPATGSAIPVLTGVAFLADVLLQAQCAIDPSAPLEGIPVGPK